MKFFARLVSFLVAIVLVGGCSSTTVTEREIVVTEKVPRPDHILIYDFAATPADVPADSSLAAAAATSTPQTADSKAPGAVVPAGVAVATANPIGIFVGTGIKGYGEVSGSSRIEGGVEQIAAEIARRMETRFREQGWIK